MDIHEQNIVNDTIELKVSIIGCDFEDKLAILNLKTRELICEEVFSMKPYIDNKPFKQTRKFIVPMETVKHIKSYLY